MKKLKLKLSSISKNLALNKLLDLSIVILGVTIAFQLNNLKQRNDQNSLERFYLESLLSDLEKDLQAYENILNDLKADRRLADSALLKLNQRKYVSDSLGVVLVNVMSLNTFKPNNSTYSTLLSSNGLNTISDRDIRNYISEHYNLYNPIYRFESVYTEVLLNLFQYFSPSCDFSSEKIVDLSVAEDVQTRNQLLVARSQLNDGISHYQRSREKARTLVESISSFLEK